LKNENVNIAVAKKPNFFKNPLKIFTKNQANVGKSIVLIEQPN
jgi:hypothetical protein